MDDYAFMISLPAQKLLALAIQEYWKNELDIVESPQEAKKFLDLVNSGDVVEFIDYICNKTNSSALFFVLNIINDEENSDGRNIDDVPDSQWLTIKNQLKTDLIGWLD